MLKATIKDTLWPDPSPSAPAIRQASLLLALLLTIDLAFIGMHLLLYYGSSLDNELFALSKDRSYPEQFQYLKELVIALLLVGSARRRGDWRYLVWATLFVYLLADDYLTLHETIGATLSRRYDFPNQWGLRGQDFGELSVYLIVGCSFLVLFATVFYTGNPTFRHFSYHLLGLLVFFASFVVIGDMLHALVTSSRLIPLFDVPEDGSEMVGMSLLLWAVYRHWLAAPTPAPAR